MERALEIINKYIHAFDEQLNAIVSYEMSMTELNCLTKSEAERCDREWKEAYAKRTLLIVIRDEIKRDLVE